MGSAPSPTEDNIFRNYIFSLAPSDPAHGWAEALEFLSSKELAGELFELRSFNLITLNHLPQKLRTIFRDCFKRVLLLASNFEENIRARDTLRQLARLLPTLILAHGDKVAMTRAKAFMMGDWKSLWNKCLAQGQARSDRLKKDPQTATTRSKNQVDVLAQKYARAGNLSKASQQFARPSSPRSALTLSTNSGPRTRRAPPTLTLATGRRPTRWMFCVEMTTGRIF